MDAADLTLVAKHTRPRPARKARKKPSERKTTAPSELDEQENRMHRAAVAASLTDEQRLWKATQAIFIVARGGSLEMMAGVWAFPDPDQRYGYVEGGGGEVEYCVLVRPQGCDLFIQMSTGIVRLQSGEYVQAEKAPVLQDVHRGYVMRVVAIEKDNVDLETVSSINGFVSDALHMADVISRQYTSNDTGTWATGKTFGVARRRCDKEVMDRFLRGEADEDDVRRWSSHVHPWDVAESIETDDVDEFARRVIAATADTRLGDSHVLSMEHIPTSNLGIIPCIWAVQRGNRSTWIPRTRLYGVCVDDVNGFCMIRIC